jgi:hypothetical protein
MKSDLFLTLSLRFVAVIVIGYFIIQKSNELELSYDPARGRHNIKARKNRLIDWPTPLILEGEQSLMRVMVLPGWVPLPGGFSSEGERFLTSTDRAAIERVIYVMDVIFTSGFEGQSVFHSFLLLDLKTGKQIADILKDNVGKTLLSVEVIEIPED